MSEPFVSALVARGFALIETHISRVLLRGDDVYKIKRPVDLGFLDFRTLDARKRACEAEVVLNRRLAPDVYLGVVALVEEAGGLSFVAASEGPVLEWAVHMRRLQDVQRADLRLEAGTFGSDDLVAIAALLVRFHAAATRDGHIGAFGGPHRIAENVEENFQQTQRSIDAYLAPAERDELARYQHDFLQRERARFERRVEARRVCDGHGDLRLEHLYRLEGAGYIAIDCIEFNERFRYADVAADLAFLTMDLRYHGRADFAEQLIAAYARASGDYALYGVLDFYESYRAFVRAKVSSIVADDADVASSTRERARSQARRYYLLALAASKRPLRAPRLIVTFGTIASGKSTLADELGRALSCPVISADLTRKQLLGIDPTSPRHDAPFQGAYSAELTERVYSTLLEHAGEVVRSGRSAIVDATFSTRAQREDARALAHGLDVTMRFIECWCSRDEALRRLASRAQQASVSDGRAEIYDDVASRFEPTDELSPAEHLRIDTRESPARTLTLALAHVGRV